MGVGGTMGSGRTDASGRDGGAAWPQVSYLLAYCWHLHESIGIPPNLGEGPRCHAESRMEEEDLYFLNLVLS